MESRVQTQSDRVQYNDLQSLLCATLQSVLRKVEPEHAPYISDAIMSALLQMFHASVNNRSPADAANGVAGGGVQEDALMAVGTLVEVLGAGFNKYLQDFKPFLIIGLKNIQESAVSGVAKHSVFKFMVLVVAEKG